MAGILAGLGAVGVAAAAGAGIGYMAAKGDPDRATVAAGGAVLGAWIAGAVGVVAALVSSDLRTSGITAGVAGLVGPSAVGMTVEGVRQLRP